MAVSGCAKKEAAPPPPPVAVKAGTVLQKVRPGVKVKAETVKIEEGSTAAPPAAPEKAKPEGKGAQG